MRPGPLARQSPTGATDYRNGAYRQAACGQRQRSWSHRLYARCPPEGNGSCPQARATARDQGQLSPA
ncbi:hypothetical protein BHM03_00061594 [Ensete ventricosum]|nr:hypothetical protein BHM03_00061594 [Ensete ventricosum]